MMITTTTMLSFDAETEKDLITRFGATHSDWRMSTNALFTTFTKTMSIDVRGEAQDAAD